MTRTVRMALVGGVVIFTAVFGNAVRTALTSQAFALSPVASQAGADRTRAARLEGGQNIFRFDTFDNEQLWTNELRMHEALLSVNPMTALAVGLKVDVEALPTALVDALQAGQVDLTDPAVTIELFRLNAVVGVVGNVDNVGRLTSVGITCALCHSTVDNSFTTGIGRRLDGWPNRDLNVGAILGLSPVLEDPGWGPGKYDPRHQVFDGKNIITRHTDTLPVLIPAAFGLQGVRIRDLYGDGPICTGIATSGFRRWAARATSATLASDLPSRSSRIVSPRNCRHCSSISSVCQLRFRRAGASMRLQRVAANVCSTAKLTARDVTSLRHIPTCRAVPTRPFRFFMIPPKLAPKRFTPLAVPLANTERHLCAVSGSILRISTTAALPICSPS